MMKNNYLNFSTISWLLCIVLLPVMASTQEAYPAFEVMKAQFPGEHAVMLEDKSVVSIKVLSGKTIIEKTITEAYMILDQTGVAAHKNGIISFSSEEIKDIKAHSLDPSGKRYRVTNFETVDVLADGYIFYDGSKETRFTYPSVEVGSIVYLSYARITDEAHFSFRHHFASNIPVLKSSFQVICDPTVDVACELKNIRPDQLNIVQGMDGKRTYTTWETDSVYLYKYEPNAPGVLTYMPHILGRITSYRGKEGSTVVLEGVAGLHQWYQSNIAEVESELPSAELRQIADSLTRQLPDEFSKVKAVYYWVQENIKYIAFEEGIHGFVPRQPNNVLHKRYGDCKDMASILYSMLKSIGVSSQLTWVGTRDLPYKYEEFPSTVVDNHMIATYRNGNELYVLDATSSFQPIDLPTSFIQGKELLVHTGKDAYEIYPLPVMPAQKTLITDTTRILLKGTGMTGSTRQTRSGYAHIDLYHMLKHAAAEDRQKRIATAMQKGNNSFKVRNVSVEQLDNRSQPAGLSYDFEIQNNVVSTNDAAYVNMVLDNKAVELIDTRKRTLPIELDNCSEQQYTTIVTIPEGYEATALPKDVTYTSEYADYSVAYRKEQNTVVCRVVIVLKQLIIPVAGLGEWKTFTAIREKSLLQKIEFIKKQ